MSTLILRNHYGESVEVGCISATEAKNSFGGLLEHTASAGMVAITRHDEPRAVLLSIEQYEALIERIEDPLDALRADFDSLVARMQTPTAKAAGAALFDSSEQELEVSEESVTSPRR